MNKRILVFITALTFLFGQLFIICGISLFFNPDNNKYFDFALSIVWCSALSCGLYSHWALVYINKTINKTKKES